MRVAIGFRRVDAGRLNDDVDTQVAGVPFIELDGTGEVDEPAAHLAEQVAHLEGDL